MGDSWQLWGDLGWPQEGGGRAQGYRQFIVVPLSKSAIPLSHPDTASVFNLLVSLPFPGVTIRLLTQSTKI